MRSLVAAGAPTLPDGVVFERGGSGRGAWLRLRATGASGGFATGSFARPSASVGLTISDDPRDPRLLGFAFTQFAMPVVAGRAVDFDFHPAANLHSPPAVGVLLINDGDRCTLLAPVTNVHEQVIGCEDGVLRWGWHGDLESVPAGFETTLGLYDGTSAADVLARWSADVRSGRPGRAASWPSNPVTSHLSYWTDNGAAYWYRTEAGRTIARSVIDAVQALRRDGVPVHAVELDSWFYPHETARPIAAIGYPSEVPPTGMLAWTPRDDAFDPPAAGDRRDGVERLAAELDHPPLVLHSRHIAPSSPYIEPDGWWVDAFAAQPEDPMFFARWFADAQRWGACCIEQDWMLMYWFGVRALRAAPGRALAWQRALDEQAGAHGMGLLWCMPTPADLVAAATLDHVVAVRTSDDYRFADDPALLWTWFLTVNRLAAALHLHAYKDCFFSQRPGAGVAHDPIDGDEHAEVEALLAAMSCGPVGIGDRIGHTDREVVLRTCDGDGRIRHVDHPIGLVDDCLFGAPARGERLAWATTTATRGDEVWTYVVALNTAHPPRRVADRLDLAGIGIDGPRAVYDWRARSTAAVTTLRADLDGRDWALFVVAPPGVDDPIAKGDPTKYVVVPSGVTKLAPDGTTGGEVTRPSGPPST